MGMNRLKVMWKSTTLRFFSLPKTAKSLEPFSPQLGRQVFWVEEATCVVRQPQRQREAEAAAAALVKSCHELEDPAANSWLSIASTAAQLKGSKAQGVPLHPWREPHLFHYD